MKCLELYPDVKEVRENYGGKNLGMPNIWSCNNWLCPFCNNGICVWDDDCMWNKEFDNDLNILYELSSDLNEDEVNFAFEAWREMMIERYGRK